MPLIGTYHISTLTIYSKRFGLQAVLHSDAACAITSFQIQKRPFQPLNLTFCPKVGGGGVLGSFKEYHLFDLSSPVALSAPLSVDKKDYVRGTCCFLFTSSSNSKLYVVNAWRKLDSQLA